MNDFLYLRSNHTIQEDIFMPQTFKAGLFLGFIITLISCSSSKPEIEAVCEIDKLFSYTIKWDIYPKVDGVVKIYTSTDPDYFDTEKPAFKECNIEEGSIHFESNRSLRRQFFLLRFNEKYDYILGTRAQRLNYVENFRDIGGYKNDHNKMIKWAKLYRSGCLDSLDYLSIKRLKLMRIRSIIDLRSTEQVSFPSSQLGLENVINLPISLHSALEISDKVSKNELMRGDAYVYMQDLNLEMAQKAKPAFRSMFNQLIVEENYPVIINCNFGKDYTGFAVALILAALDVPEQTIIDDYMLSNKYLNKKCILFDIDKCPSSTQEAITTIMNADEKYIGYALNKIKKDYGSIHNYLVDELGLSADKQRKLKHILLQ